MSRASMMLLPKYRVTVKETIPNRVIDEATEIEPVDLAPPEVSKGSGRESIRP